MKTKWALLGAVATVAMLGASAASATTLFFSITGYTTDSWYQDSNPTSSFYDIGHDAIVPIHANPYLSAEFYSAIEGGGVDYYYGPQLYTGTEDAPVFAPTAPGSPIELSYNGPTGPGAELTITAVPEPATWALMLAGFGGMGAMLRSQRRKLAPVAA